MKIVKMDDIYKFVNDIVGPKNLETGDSAPMLTDSDFELLDIQRDFDSAWMNLNARKASSVSEWQFMFKQVVEEYAPRFQAWSDKNKLDYQFK